MTLWTPLTRHGISSVNYILVDWLKFSKLYFLPEDINIWKEFISLKPMQQCCSEKRFDWCLFLNYYWVWSPSKETLPLHLSMQIYLRIRRSTLKCQEYLNSSPRMDIRNVWSWKRFPVVSVIFHVPSVNTWQISLNKVVWSSQSYIPKNFQWESHVYRMRLRFYILG